MHPYKFSKGMQVVKLIEGFGAATASLDTVEYARKTVVKLSKDESLRYDPQTGREINPAIPGFSSRILPIEQ